MWALCVDIGNHERGEVMTLPALEDAILRENRRSEIARRLILHRVRTQIISRLTGLTRNRLTTVRRRLMIGNGSRVRGPTRNPLNVFFGSPRARSEGAALASLFCRFGTPLHQQSITARGNGSIELAEQLCEVYETYRACCPRTQVQLEELIMFRSLLAKGGAIELRTCGRCKRLILIDRFDGKRACSHCGSER
jgi:hypothetical protein